MKTSAGRCCLLAVAGCNSQDDSARYSAERSVAANLKDPDSAKFSGEFIVRRGKNENGFDDLSICELVNGKNSFGAYSGPARFVTVQSQSDSTLDTYITVVENYDNSKSFHGAGGTQIPTIFESVYWNKYCVDSGHQPTFTGERVSSIRDAVVRRG